MAEIQALRGLRYDLGHVGSLSDVVAPPYDVIGPELQQELYKKHPANVVRLILNRDEPGDDQQGNRYTRAARFLKSWRREGVLQREADPAIYVYHQAFSFGGRNYTRRGFMARVRLEPFGEGHIYPHEETHSPAKADRLKLMKACRANLSQIFGLYLDPENRAQQLLETVVAGLAPIEATDHLGVVHRIWPVTDVKVISDLAAAAGPCPIFIADGHHRYETACNYRDWLAAQKPLAPPHPANFVLMMCVSMDDPGMIVLPTHRLLRGLPPLSSEELVKRLDGAFQTEVVGSGADHAPAVWRTIQQEGAQETLGLFAAADQRWIVARIAEGGRARMAATAASWSPQWRGLGVSILHRLVIETLLDGADLPEPTYVHQVEELVEALQSSPEYSLAALVMPATLDHVRAISERGERMPPKSTYFYPKLLSGLVVNPLD